MNGAIWKYPVEATDSFLVEMPIGARILSVQVQRDEVCMWALVDPNAPTEGRRFNVYGTGHPIRRDPGEFVGTFQLRGGALVFHLFAERAALVSR